MKIKIPAILIAATLFILSLASCNNSKGNASSKENPVSNIESYAKVGRVDTIEVKVGDSVESVCRLYGTTLDQLKLKAEREESNAEASTPEDDESHNTDSENSSEFDSQDSGEESENYSETELSYSVNDGLVKLTADDAFYYFKESSIEHGIILIVAFNDPYLLTVGASTPDVVGAMVDKKSKYFDVTQEGDWFFIFGEPAENSRKIVYEFGKYDVQFMFQDELLFCVMIYDNSLWGEVIEDESSAGAGSSVSNSSF